MSVEPVLVDAASLESTRFAMRTQAAARLGMPSPATAVGSEGELIPRELGERLVVKPLGAAHYTDADGAGQLIWAQSIHRDSDLLELPGERLPLDWRGHEPGHGAFIAASTPQ